jgi:hypothetical protein
MLNLNQRSLPCKRQTPVSWMFLSVQRILQISLFLYCCCPVCSPLFRGVVVKLSSTGVTSKLAFSNRRGLCPTAVTDKKLLVPTNRMRKARLLQSSRVGLQSKPPSNVMAASSASLQDAAGLQFYRCHLLRRPAQLLTEPQNVERNYAHTPKITHLPLKIVHLPHASSP